jgi:hypothetical protein
VTTTCNKLSAFGNVTSAKVMMERDTGRSKGFGFVEMGSDAEAQAAIGGMNGQQFGGRGLVVNEARPMEARPPRTGGGGFGGGAGGGGGGGGYGGGGSLWVAAVSWSMKPVRWKPARRAVAALGAAAADMAVVVAAATAAVVAAVAVKAVAAATAAVVVVAAVETAASVAPMAPARAVGAMAVAAVAVAAAATKNKRLLREPFLCLLLSLKRLRQVGSFRARQALASGTGP